MLKIISGSLLIVSLFVGLFVLITYKSGFNIALEGFGIAFAITFFIVIAVHLIVSGQEN